MSNGRKSREGEGTASASPRRRVIVPTLVAAIAVGAAAFGAASSHLFANDGTVAMENRRKALQSALGDFRAVFGKGNQVDPRFVHMIEQSIGLNDLRFEQEPPVTGREMQPVVNAEGRIVGFFTWNAVAQTNGPFVPWVAGAGFALLAFAGVALWRRRDQRDEDGYHNAEPPRQVEPASTETDERQFIRRELPRALREQMLDVHYQPIVAAAGGGVTGVEALLRWTHPEQGAISPAKFIPVAEQMGLMDELGVFVLRRALDDARKWPDIYISVNLSPVQVRDSKIVEVVRAALADSGIAPSRLVLEITEGVLIDKPEEMLKRIEELRALGVRIALDDFGSGYSSLGYLQRFSFDKLKIDRAFVAALGRSSNAAVIVQAIVALGRALGVAVVVEGVETEEQRVLLRLAGCDEMQGFLFARPAPAGAIAPLLAPSRAA